MDLPYVFVTDELQLHAHASNVGGTHVGAVHQTDTVHGTNSEDETDVDAADDGALLSRREAMVIVNRGGTRGGGLDVVSQGSVLLRLEGVEGAVVGHVGVSGECACSVA